MNTREQTELENAALANEVSRQVAHEFSNFVYNLYLRIEIAENAAQSQPVDWTPLKQESRRMANLLRQWERYHSRTLAEEPAELDLHELIRRAVSDASPRGIRVDVPPAISAGTLPIMGGALEVKHLLRLLLEETFLACRESAWSDATVSLRTERINDRAVVRILAAGQVEENRATPRAAAENVEEASPASLLRATCRSLAVRLDAGIQREPGGRDGRLVSVDFPVPLTTL